MDGLAQSVAGPSQAPQAPQQDAAMLEQVMQALMEGIDPEELIKQGVPPELIMQAIEILEQQMGVQEQPSPQGLAQSVAG